MYYQFKNTPVASSSKKQSEIVHEQDLKIINALDLSKTVYAWLLVLH